MVNARGNRHNERSVVRTRHCRVPPDPHNRHRRAPSPVITSHMRVADVTALIPDADKVLAEYGIHCAGCAMGGLETLDEGCRLHGFDTEEVAELVDDLNTLMKEMPDRPRTLTVTLPAARAIKSVIREENKTGQNLLVTVDGNGGFCMEFQDELPRDARTFTHDDEPDVRVLATDLTLRRIGGATIDFREGRFKLDLAE